MFGELKSHIYPNKKKEDNNECDELYEFATISFFNKIEKKYFSDEIKVLKKHTLINYIIYSILNVLFELFSILGINYFNSIKSNIKNKFCLIKKNTSNNIIQYDVTNCETYEKIKKEIENNFIIISNILEYSDTFKQKEGMIGEHSQNIYELHQYDDYKTSKYSNAQELFDEWIKPIFPDTNSGSDYAKILSEFIDKRTIQIENEEYVDIICSRNFIQTKFKSNLKSLYHDDISTNDENIMDDPIRKIMLISPIYCTYRFDHNHNKIMIMH